MKGPDVLKAAEGPMMTRAGACFPGQRTVFRGHDLHADLMDMDWIELYVFGITGRRLSPEQVRVLHTLWTCTSYPDARLWNNRVAALAGSARSTGALGVAAAIAVSEAAIYGWQPEIAAADFLSRARVRIEAGETLRHILDEEIRLHKYILGYGRPVATQQMDERIPVVLERLEREGIGIGPHLALAFEVEKELAAMGRKLPMTYAAVIAAVPLDMGFSARELYLFVLPSFMAGMPPCYREAAEERPEGATFALRCRQVHYEGPGRRKWSVE